MARALECPACGARHRLDALPNAPTFRCERCGQVLKVPTESDRADGGANGKASGGTPSDAPSDASSDAPAPPARRSGNAPVAPPPRRRPAGAPVPALAAEAVGVTATVAANEPPLPPNGKRGEAPAVKVGLKRKGVAWYWRLVAWIVAVPLGFVITAWPAYNLDWIRKDDVLNVFVGSGTGRYARLAVGTAIWALVTALLVQLFVEGGRWFAARRHARGPKPDPRVPGPPTTPPPKRPAAQARR